MHWELPAELNGRGLFMMSLWVSAGCWLSGGPLPPPPRLACSLTGPPVRPLLPPPAPSVPPPKFLITHVETTPVPSGHKSPQAQRLGQAPIREGCVHGI